VIVLPALDEESCVAETVARWRLYQPLEIRVVDNGSSDATAAAAAAAGAAVCTEPRRGYGAAAWRGIQRLPPACRWVIFSSADGSDRLEAPEARAWRRQADRGADLIVGDRVTRTEARQHLKGVQSLGNRLCVLLIRLGWGRAFRDMGSLRWIRREALEALDLRDRGFGWNVEMQVRAIEHGMRIVELPVGYHPREAGRSKISGSTVGTFRAAAGILGVFWRLHRSRVRAAAPARRARAEPVGDARIASPLR
jgi:glycosyltransferase involved in cell wall biosynthesis